MTQYEHLVFDIGYAALRVIAQRVRAAVGGTPDMGVQVELENFANECDNRIQHHEREMQTALIAQLNAQHKVGAPGITHKVIEVAPSDDFGDLL